MLVQSLTYSTTDFGDDAIDNLTNIGGTLYFAEYDPSHGSSSSAHWLAALNGTTVEDLAALSDNPFNLTGVDGTVFFNDHDGDLFRYAASGAQEVFQNGTPGAHQIGLVPNLTPGGGNLYFFGTPNGAGASLFELAGPDFGSGGATALSLPQGTSLTGASSLTNVNGVLFLAANTSVGPALYSIQGSSVTLLSNTISYNPGGILPSNDTVPFNPSAVGNLLFFSANDGTHGQQLWSSDGSPSGTQMVKAFNAGTADSDPGPSLTIGSTTYFVANGADLWKSDGTAAGTIPVESGVAGIGPIFTIPSALIDVGGRVVFQGAEGSLWSSDGTPTGTQSIFSGGVGANYANADEPIDVGGSWYFLVEPNQGLWRTDGTASGTEDIVSGGIIPYGATDLTAFDGALYFLVPESDGAQLWTSNGTALGTVLVRDFSVGFPAPASLQVAGGTLFVTLSGESLFSPSSQLWASNGTPTGTVLLNSDFIASSALAPVAGGYLFGGYDSVYGSQPWFTDGSAAGTRLLNVINPNGDSNPQDLVSLGSIAIFVASDSSGTYQLYATNGTAAALTTLKDFGALEPTSFTLLDGKVYFVADDGTHGWQLWVTDGTVAGTQRVTNVNPGGGGLEPNNQLIATTLTVVDGKLFFSGQDGIHGDEPWVSDGTAGGTYMLADADSGDGGSDPHNFADIGGGKIYFTATDGTHGIEPWVLTPVVPLVVTAGPAISATVGGAVTQTLATFTDPNGAGTSGTYSATINWGDTASATAGTVSGPDAAGVFTVVGSHTYTDQTATPETVSIVIDRNGSPDGSASETATVADASLVVTPATITATAGTSTAFQVATFTDPGGAQRVGDYSATINWGDNSTSDNGTIMLNGGVFTISGAHTYAAPGTMSAVLTIDHGGAAPVTATATVAVTSAVAFAASDMAYTIGSGTVSVSAADGLLKNATGPTQLSVTAGTVTGGQGGTFVFNADGSLTYTPGANSPGYDSAQFTVTDASGDKATQTVTLLARNPTSNEQSQYASQMEGAATDRTIEQEITNLPEYANNPPAPAAGTATALPNFYQTPAQSQAAAAAKDALFASL